jgi:hypothetical protein
MQYYFFYFLLLWNSEIDASKISIPLSRKEVTFNASRTLYQRHTDRINAGRMLPGSSETVPIFGEFRRLAYFYADLFVGTNSQKFSVIADTGSSLTAVPCTSCTDCGPHQNPKYDPLLSTTASKMMCSGGGGCPGSGRCDTDGQCGYSMSYAEGSSLNGKLWQDNVYLGEANAGGAPAQMSFPFVLGCGQHEGGLFTSQDADGIMGLGQADEKSAIMRAMYKSGVLTSNIFSLCLSFYGGALTVGGIDNKLHYIHSKTSSRVIRRRMMRNLHGDNEAAPSLGPMIPSVIRWAQMSIPSFYEVNVLSVSMPLSSISIPHQGFVSPRTILDSGTTFTYIPHLAYEALRTAISSYCAVDRLSRCVGTIASILNEPLCYRLEDLEDIETFPTFTIELAGHNGGPSVVLSIPPVNLFVSMGWDSGAHCLAVYDNGNGGGVIGANAMMGNDVIFDLSSNSPRVGFAESAECKIFEPPLPSTTTSTATATVTATVTVSSTPVIEISALSSIEPSQSAQNTSAISSSFTPTTSPNVSLSSSSTISNTPIPPSRSSAPSFSQSQFPQQASTFSSRTPSVSTSSAAHSAQGGDGNTFESATDGSIPMDSTSLLTIVGISVLGGMIICFLFALCCATLRSRIALGGLVITRQSSTGSTGYSKVIEKAKGVAGQGVVLDGGAKISDDDDEDDIDDERIDEEERVTLVESKRKPTVSLQPSQTSSSRVIGNKLSSSSSLPAVQKSSSSLTVSRKAITVVEDDDEGWGDDLEDLDDNDIGGVSGNDKGLFKDQVTRNTSQPAASLQQQTTSKTSGGSSKMTLGKKPNNSISVSIK